MRRTIERAYVNRRAHPRVDLTHAATLLSGGVTVGRYMVQNLSAGGALLTGASDVGRAGPLSLTLELPCGHRLTVGAEVRRRGHMNGLVALAVAFEHLEEGSEDRIQDAVLAMLDRDFRDANPAVLIVEAALSPREALCARVSALGHRVIPCAAPLDAVTALSDPSERVGAVLAREESEPSAALLEWVAETHLHVRSILLVENDRRSDPAAPHQSVRRCFAEQLDDVL